MCVAVACTAGTTRKGPAIVTDSWLAAVLADVGRADTVRLSAEVALVVGTVLVAGRHEKERTLVHAWVVGTVVNTASDTAKAALVVSARVLEETGS